MDERRGSLRIPLSTDVNVTRDGDTFAAVSTNVSTGGMLLDTGEKYPQVGDVLVLEFEIPGLEEKVTTNVVVRWADTVRANLIGVEFTAGLRAREVYAIAQLKA
jgi:Tfp pilus assembly protein PilZ